MAHDHTHADPSFAGSCFICNAARDDGSSQPKISRRGVLSGAAKAPLAAGLLAGGGVLGGAMPARAHDDGGAPPSGRYVIEAGWALTEDDAGELALIRNASILVNDDMIEDVVEGAIVGDFARVQVPGDLVLPGFISGHTHACSATPTRGVIEGGRSFARPLVLVEELSDDEMDALTAFNVAELLRGGCTTHVEMSLSLRQAESYVRVAKRWGVRGFPGGMVPGIARLFPIWFRQDDETLMQSEAGTLEEIAANLAFARANLGAENGRIMPMMSPHATDTQTPATLDAFRAAAEELGTGLHIHLSQSTRETETVRRLWGMTPTQWLASHGLMDGPLFGAHMTGLDFQTDPAVLNAHGAVYSHCPSGGGAGGGTQPYPEALAAGMNVNIGIDTHSNDYVENMKLAVLYGQARQLLLEGRDGALPMAKPTIWSAVDGATRVAADGLRRSDLGRIKPGAKADLTTVDVTSYLVGTGALPPEPLNNLLYAHGLSVRHVITDGTVQIWHGHLTVDDEAEVIRAGGAAVQRIWDMLEAEDWFTPTER